MRTRLTDMLHLEHPLIMAPMFLVSNVAMMKEGMRCGVAGCIPALNYRTLEELQAACRELKAAKAEIGKGLPAGKAGAYGFNLIVNKSNPKAAKQLEMLCEEGCDFIITSLGSPEETIKAAHQVGIKVFCDVTDLRFAQKVEALGADAVIAVNNEAGGHRGGLSPQELIVLLKKHCSIPVISAGGVGNKAEMDQMLAWGAEGVSVGSPFIASAEAPITDDYKQACVDYGAKDIVLTERISGTPCTVINTPYVQKVGAAFPVDRADAEHEQEPEEVGEDAALLHRHEGHGGGGPAGDLQDRMGGRAQHPAHQGRGAGKGDRETLGGVSIAWPHVGSSTGNGRG